MSCARMVVNRDGCIGEETVGDPLLVCVPGDAAGVAGACEAESHSEGEISVPDFEGEVSVSLEMATAELPSPLSP